MGGETYIPLSKSTHANSDERAMPISRCLDQSRPPCFRGLALHLDCMRYLRHLELDQWMGCISRSVKTSEQFFGFVFLSIGNQPSVRGC